MENSIPSCHRIEVRLWVTAVMATELADKVAAVAAAGPVREVANLVAAESNSQEMAVIPTTTPAKGVVVIF